MYSIRPTIHGRSADRVRMFFPATERRLGSHL